MWVLIYLCMATDGPGGKAREALTTDGELSTRINEYFLDDQVTIRQFKLKAFYEPDKTGYVELEEDLLKHFHPSFEGVKDLIRQWVSTLRLCYKFPQCRPAVHELFLEKINQTIAQFQEPSDPVYLKYSEEERMRRKRCLSRIKDFRRTYGGGPPVFGPLTISTEMEEIEEAMSV